MSMDLKMNGLWRYVQDDEILDAEPLVKVAQDTLEQRKGAGNDFLGWLDLPENYDREEFTRIKQAAEKIRKTADVLIVIGIGGSYLGARAAIEFVNGQMYNQVRPEGTPEVYFAGNNISSSYLNDLVKIIGDRDFCINVISKSGTTTEPAIAFRIFKELCEKKYGREGAKERIFATTDKERGALKQLADDEGYETFVVPDDIGGRFSVLTPVGLLPMAAAGVNIDEVMRVRRSRVSKTATPPIISRQNTPRCAAFCTARASRWKSSSTMNRRSSCSASGSSSCSTSPRARTTRAFSLRARISRPTCIPSASSFRTARA